MVAVKRFNGKKKNERSSVLAVMFLNIICTGLMPKILIQELSDRQKIEFPYFNEVG